MNHKNLKTLALSASIALALSQSAWANSYFDNNSQILHIPETDAGILGSYQLDLLVINANPVILELQQNSIVSVNASADPDATYRAETGGLVIESIDLNAKQFYAELSQLAGSYQFELTQLTEITTTNPPVQVSGVIVDTGQTSCYDNSVPISCPEAGSEFFGQDAQYTGTQAQYSDNGDGTVTDNVTGLMWVQSVDTNGDGAINASDKFSFSNAGAYVDSLNSQNHAGYNDWRLPSIKEQYSLMDFRGADPSGETSNDTSSFIPYIDGEVFGFNYGDTNANERVIDAQYASSSLYVSTASGEQLLFGVNFADGRIKGYGLQLMGQDKTFYVQPVRGEVYGNNQFVDNNDGTVTDQASNLMWTQNDSSEGMNWQQALTWATQKNAENYLGYNDWRLPNVKELQFIVDYSRSPDTSNSAAIDPILNTTVISNEAGQDDYAYYWSSTTHVSSNGMGAGGSYVAFGRSLGYMNGSWHDVHGAGSQRSDPKTGNASDYPTGHGPQGDAIRINNYVRLVRGGVSDAIHTGGSVAVVNPNTGGDTTQPPPSDSTTPDGQQPPQEALSACANQTENSSCTIQTPQGDLSGVCLMVVNNSLACVPENAPLN
ncbi:DUF1566 domain-containing protein [Candidatus Venteria ishoeyi]|uniref:Lcl C-terminal domain-containing protein n=1 Tax=Candidatus Venteria ishoeyi TaxID=1899563 RepID=UPI0025A673C6|nr:DUF1566 domain-containing protein [Candidatus Venteria ishoeyi]MDM8545012.1 DUF1566 domain-containing protein [Candidatus Venteria ishoeyi]